MDHLIPWVLIFAGIVILLAIGFAPRSCRIEGNDLRVTSWLKTYQYDLGQATSAELIDRSTFNRTNTVRVCGVGWPFKRYGWFWNRDKGIFFALTTNLNNMVLLTMPNQNLLVSPDNVRDLFVRFQS